jgi:outer membrane protein OmpA-like peptidoglycan-associated protein
MLWPILWLGNALAQQAVSLEIIHTVHAPKHPALVLHPNIDAESIHLKVQCGSTHAAYLGTATARKSIRVELKVPEGKHTCTGSLDGEFSDGTSGSMPLNFEVIVQVPIQLQVNMNDLDLDHNRLRVHVDRPIAQLDIDVYGESGQIIGRGRRPGGGPTPLEIEWTQSEGAVTRLAIKATGQGGMATVLDLFPWSYNIPHEDVTFPSGSAAIPHSERRKLNEAKGRIDQTLSRFSGGKLGFEIPMQLFVAGFTDTVGSTVSNQRLSESRARALGGWFRANGFDRPIQYQGFGERGLAVATPDETDAPANRRVLYIIAAEPPTQSTSLPGSNWKRLR